MPSDTYLPNTILGIYELEGHLWAVPVRHAGCLRHLARLLALGPASH